MAKPKSKTKSKTSIKFDVSWRPRRYPVKWVLEPETEDDSPEKAVINAVYRGNNFPRLMQAARYPDESNTIPLLLYGPEATQKVSTWLARGQVYKDVLKLFKSLFVVDEQPFANQVIEIVGKHALLNPEHGDTLEDWQKFVLEVTYLFRLYRELIQHIAANGPKAALQIQTMAVELAHSLLLSAPEWPKKALFSRQIYYSKAGALIEAQALYNSFELTLDLFISPTNAADCMARIALRLKESVNGAKVRAGQSGVWLECGVREWAMLELGELFLNVSLKRCEICLEVLEAPTQREYKPSDKAESLKGQYRKSGKISDNKETCDSVACKRALSRRRAADRIPNCIPDPKNPQESQKF